MLIIPAIDLYDGKCVRLYQGKLEEQTVFSENPLVVAREWVAAGAKLLHMVDLNGAFEGVPANLDLIYEIAKEIPIPVQLGGGIRIRNVVEDILNNGVERVVLGTTAIQDPDFVRKVATDFPNRVVLGIDAQDGQVAVRGWTEVSSLSAVELAAQFADLPLAAIVFTDIKRDGTLKGPNLISLEEMVENAKIPVIASGGIGSMEDIGRIVKKFPQGVTGIIVGRALYAGALKLGDAVQLYQGR